MNNVKSVMNYFDGNFLFNLYLKNIIGNTNDESYMYEDNLLNDINKNAVIMGCICNIMTSIKDGLNDKTNNFKIEKEQRYINTPKKLSQAKKNQKG